ncbi:DUF1206 domain-containing protein [Rubellimicrobium roseum]|uniref:DUF1206 domain-containing protein n=1 Tax=Rubellimicrobium roseum TaxID=687525 RepID=A0A5C4N7Z1_9RHOB|nr:DUF1206 domain-containing protein [Rubellimicrobium roseum]TNC69506.1 DUF1206 domain-containing protein [Rubellimicrobium roseum]
MQDDALAWTVPVMRAGFAGRGLTYLVIAGFSLWALAQGRQAQGPSSALARLETTAGGGIVLALIFLGLLAYALWCVLAAALDLDAHGQDAKGLAARAGQVVTGLAHLSLGLAALTLLVSSGGTEGESRLREWVGTVMGWPGGRWLVGLAGLVVMGVGVKYVVEGWTAGYERTLAASAFTTRWRNALRFGLAAHGTAVAVIGLLFLLAAWRANPQEAGGLAGVFDWLGEQAHGRILLALLCLGLLAFSLFCFVNARWRIVPRVAGDKTETLSRAVRRLAAGAL